MSQCIRIEAPVNDSFSSDLLDALDHDRRHEPTEAEWRDWEMVAEYEQMQAEEEAERSGVGLCGFGTFGLPANEADYS